MRLAIVTLRGIENFYLVLARDNLDAAIEKESKENHDRASCL